ncbi:hypothetical protein KSP40_PGU008216 [Platanthera guangdongensis]|uniref:Uncharacterized protein n=1 Tax=Platanthera guangdongensis TaxID=2320717 RepID=A0ABR2M5J8_9ASPA
MESPISGSESDSPCWKKKSAEGGLIADMKDHADQFLHTSMEHHRICLKKTIRGLSEFLKLRKSRSRNMKNWAREAREGLSGTEEDHRNACDLRLLITWLLDEVCGQPEQGHG